jgi:hypothetical protein
MEMLMFTPDAWERLWTRAEVSKSVWKMSAATLLASRRRLASTTRLMSARSTVSAEASTELLRKDTVGQLTAVAGHVAPLCAAIALLSRSEPLVALTEPPVATKDRSTMRLTTWRYNIDAFGCPDVGRGGGADITCCKRRVPLAVGVGTMGGGDLAGGSDGGGNDGGNGGGDGRTADTSQFIISAKLHMDAWPAACRGVSTGSN